jgi:hypothetical protein
MSHLYNKDTDLGVCENLIPQLTNKKSRLSIPEPTIAVSFEGAELRKQVETTMLQHGFKKEPSSRQIHYTGTGSSAAIQDAVSRGADINCWASSGMTNVSGYLAFITIRSLVEAALDTARI